MASRKVEVEGMGAPACRLPGNTEVLQQGRAIVMVIHFFKMQGFHSLPLPLAKTLYLLENNHFPACLHFFQTSLEHRQTMYKHCSSLWRHNKAVRALALEASQGSWKGGQVVTAY